MPEKRLPMTGKELEAWRAEVARGNPEANLRTRPSLRRVPGALVTKTEVIVPIEEPGQPSLSNQPAQTVRKSDS